MLRCSLVLFTFLILYFTLTSDTPSEEKIQPKIKIRRSQMLFEGDKRYVSDVEYGEKRYVSDRKKEDIELRRYMGTEKIYSSGDSKKSEKEFFKREIEALYKFTSLQKNIESVEDGGEKLAIIVNKEDVFNDVSNGKVHMEKKEKVEIEKRERGIAGNERKIEGVERKVKGNERKTSTGQRNVLGNEREVISNKRNIYGNKREKLDIPTVVIEK